MAKPSNDNSATEERIDKVGSTSSDDNFCKCRMISPKGSTPQSLTCHIYMDLAVRCCRLRLGWLDVTQPNGELAAAVFRLPSTRNLSPLPSLTCSTHKAISPFSVTKLNRSSYLFISHNSSPRWAIVSSSTLLPRSMVGIARWPLFIINGSMDVLHSDRHSSRSIS